MAWSPRPRIKEEDLHGFKHFKLLLPVLGKLHHDACRRDRAGNRVLHFEQYAALILLYLFNPIVTSLRGIQQAGELHKVQRILGCSRASLGSLVSWSIGCRPSSPTPPYNEIKGILTLVDGTLRPALPQLVEAMWLDEQHRAFKLHTHFELLKGVPTRMDLTEANASERDVLEHSLQPDRAYFMDRGYAKFGLFKQILEVGSSFVCRIRDNSVFEILEARPLSAEAAEAGLARDAVVRFTGDQAVKAALSRPLRIVEVKYKPHRKSSGKTGRGGPEQGDTILMATDILDVPTEVITLIYKHRWAIENILSVFQACAGSRPPAEPRPQRDRDSNLPGHHRLFADRPVDRAQANPAHL